MSEIIYEVDEPVATITLNRPERLNAMTNSLFRDFRAAIDTAAADPDVVGIVVTGVGRAFSAGLDTDALAAIAEAGSADSGASQQGRGGLFSYLTEVPKPVIAAVNGVAAGGGFSMALASDFRVMEKSAVLRQAYTSNGLCIDGGGTFTLPRLVGYARALEIAAFDEPISADQALSWGLVTKVVEDWQSWV